MRRFGRAAVCDRCGFECAADERIHDVRGGWVCGDCADVTPGFGTYHPMDLYAPRTGGDPRAIPNARRDAPIWIVPQIDPATGLEPPPFDIFAPPPLPTYPNGEPFSDGMFFSDGTGWSPTVSIETPAPTGRAWTDGTRWTDGTGWTEAA